MLTGRLVVFLFAASVAALGADSKRESHWDGEAMACGQCHESITKQFRPTAHGKVMEFGAGPHDLTCGTCHAGDLKNHIDTADPKLVRNQAKEAPEVVAESCLTCHVTDKHMMLWRGSQHESAGIGCLSCHSMHKPSEGKMMARKTQTETCGSCHASERNAMLRRSTHLFRDERGSVRIQCASCHNPHGSQAEKLISANSVNEKCYSCHQEKRGPFLWEHHRFGRTVSTATLRMVRTTSGCSPCGARSSAKPATRSSGTRALWGGRTPCSILIAVVPTAMP